MKKPFSCLLEEEVIAEIKRRASDNISQAEVVRRALYGDGVDGSMKARLERVEEALALMGAPKPGPNVESKAKKEPEGKRQFNCLLNEEVVEEIKRRALGGLTQAEVVTKALLGEEAGVRLEVRLEKMEQVLVQLMVAVDRLTIGLNKPRGIDFADPQVADSKECVEGTMTYHPV